MATTRLIPMHINKGRSIGECLKHRTEYATNGAKTENGQYVSSYACNPETVDDEFLMSKKEYLRITGRKPKNDIIAYQIRQSFKPGEITPEEANAIGYDLAMSFTKGNHAFIVATHTDRAHIHNHIIFNSTDLCCDRKFKNFFLSSLVIQRISDGLCLQHGLSVIKPRPYRDRDNEGYRRESIRSKICEDIDAVVNRNPKSFEELLSFLIEQGYEIKRGKNLAIKSKGQKRFVRLSSLDEEHNEEALRKLFDVPGERKPRAQQRDFDLLINVQEKLAAGKGAGYERWAKVYNIKQISKALLFLQEHDVRDYETLKERATGASERFASLSQTIKDAEKRMAEIAVLRTHIINYSKTREVYVQYRQSGYSKKFLEAHREEITLHKAAKEAFKALDGKIPKVKELNAEYAELLARKKQAYSGYHEAKKEMQDYLIAKQNIDQLLGIDENAEAEKAKKKEKDKNTSL